MRRWEFLLVGLTLGMAGARLQAQAGAMYTAEWQVALPGDLPAGAMILCRARVVPGTGDAQGSGIVPVETAPGVRSTSVARCAVEVPVWWNERQTSGAWLSTEVDVLAPGDREPRVLELNEGRAVLPAANHGGAMHLSLSRKASGD